MKILVDEMPNKPSDCIFIKSSLQSIHYGDKRIDTGFIPNICNINMSKIGKFECRIGDKDFVCPYLKEFKANAIKLVPGYKHTYSIIPVKLSEE